jgi:hypothetical protein
MGCQCMQQGGLACAVDAFDGNQDSVHGWL